MLHFNDEVLLVRAQPVPADSDSELVAVEPGRDSLQQNGYLLKLGVRCLGEVKRVGCPREFRTRPARRAAGGYRQSLLEIDVGDLPNQVLRTEQFTHTLLVEGTRLDLRKGIAGHLHLMLLQQQAEYFLRGILAWIPISASSRRSRLR